MEITHLENNITVFYVQASSFPDGVLQAHNDLVALLPTKEGRSFYGISYPGKDGNIIYKAATAELYPGEADEYNCETFTIRKGPFITEMVTDWANCEGEIKSVFERLISRADIKQDGYCLEEYPNAADMRCMVPLSSDAVEDTPENLAEEVENTFNNFIKVLADFDQEQLNTLPSYGGWTAGQVADHIIKSVETISDHNTAKPNRFADEKLQPLKRIFLDFNAKFQSPKEVLPAAAPHNKEKVIRQLAEIKSKHIDMAENAELTALCMDVSFPTIGALTRYEWLKFFIYHMQRHEWQIKRILKNIQQHSVL